MPAQIITRTTHILRTCAAGMTSYVWFRWPESGHVAVPDWKPTAECGNGLHGFLEGEGDGSLADWSDDAKWLVARIESYINLDGQVEFPEAWVEFCGTREDATAYLMSLGYRGAIIGCVLRGGDRATLTGGDRATLTGGDGATLTGGHRATLTGGRRATLTGGHGATLSFSHWDGARLRVVTIYPGEDGIEPDIAYRLDDDGKPVPASFPPAQDPAP